MAFFYPVRFLQTASILFSKGCVFSDTPFENDSAAILAGLSPLQRFKSQQNPKKEVEKGPTFTAKCL